MTRITRMALAALGAGALCPVAMATGEETDTIIISALRTAQAEGSEGSAVAVVGRDVIERRALSQGADILALAPGVTVAQAGSFSGVAYARIRGGNPGQTLVVVDGSPVNDMASPGGGFDLSLLEASDISRVEVLRGSQSALWGSDAVGGVVSVVSRRPGDGPGLSGFAEAGGYGQARVGGRLSGKRGTAGGALTAAYARAGGPSRADERYGASEDDAYEAMSLSGAAEAELTARARVDLSLRATDITSEADGYPPPLYAFADTDGTADSRLLSAIGGLSLVAPDDRFRTRFEASLSETRRTDDDGMGYVFEAVGERRALRMLSTYTPQSHIDVSAGLEQEDSEAFGASARTRSVFSVVSLRPSPSVRLSAGVRSDSDDRFGSALTRRASVSFQASEAVSLRASWGEGFKSPTLFQSGYISVFCGLTAPNRDLRAERSEGADLGADIALPGADISVSVFRQKTRDLIDFTYARGYENVALARQTGLELLLDGRLGQEAGFRLGYMYLDAEDGSGAALARAPMHSGDGEIYGPLGRFRVSLALRYNGAQPDGFAGVAPAWTRVDLALTRSLSDHLEGYARLENALDEHYQPVIGFGAPRMNLTAGLRFRR